MDKYLVKVPLSIYNQLVEIKADISLELTNPSAAEKRMKELLIAFRSLEFFPERGFNADDRFGKRLHPSAVTRGLPVQKDYIILYDIEEEAKVVNIRYLLPSKSDYMKLFL